MTITNTALKTIANGNGATTVFNYSFLIPAANEVEVIYTDSSGVETTLSTSQYSITGIGNPTGGTVTYPLSGSPIASGTTLTIKRQLPLTQTRQVANQGQFYPQVVEDGLDFATMQIQQLNDLFNRALVVPDTDPSANLTIPNATNRKNQLLGFDGSGNAIAAQPSSAIVSSVMQPVVSAATLAAGRTAFGLGAAATLGVGAGLRSDGTNLQGSDTISAVTTNQSPAAANHRTLYYATNALTFTLPRANTLWSGYELTVFALTDTITFAPNAADNFYGGASGTSVLFPVGSVVKIWTNASASGTWYFQVISPQLVMPQGYLSPVSNTVVSLNDTTVSAGGNLYYVPDTGNGLPLYNGAITATYIFNTQLTLTLSSSHLASTVYDVFGTLINNEPALVTGPAWRNSGQAITGATNASPIVITANAHGLSNGDDVVISAVLGNLAANGKWTVANKTANTFELQGSTGNGAYTAGTGQLSSRGVGAGTAQIAKTPGGFYTNAVAMTTRNGSTTQTTAVNQGTFLATILMDTVNGQLTCHRTYGQSRRWGIWNAFNRKPIMLRVGDATANWTYATAAWRAARGDATNVMTLVCGLPEECYVAKYSNKMNVGNQTDGAIGVGIQFQSGTPVQFGTAGAARNNVADSGLWATCAGFYNGAPFTGAITVTALENGLSAGTITLYGTELYCLLTTEWRG